MAAARTVAAVTAEVPEYSRAEIGVDTARTIEASVELALATFLQLATDAGAGDRPARLAPALEGAYALGRGEARSGRTMEALLAAYRVGARAAWQEVSALLVRRGVPAAAVARFAELVFAYIDELSGASAAGHRDELATSGRVREQLFELLAHALVVGESPEQLALRAERAGWPSPHSITVVVLRSAHMANVAQLLDARTLRLAGDLAPGLGSDEMTVLLVPDAHRSRAALQAVLAGRGAIMGPTRPWTEAHTSYQRVVHARERLHIAGDEPLDTEDHLVTLVVTADRDALHDLRARALEPLADVRPAMAGRLLETLRSWLLHQGRRDDVAADLNVHPQTVRYRMTQLRELYGERLTDP
ncbi:MAG: PucR family transcriptional regulator, partial [Actinomycetia bacterium]|nr:PucR family transcriptional regulator [Actinomycetes bacterium]